MSQNHQFLHPNVARDHYVVQRVPSFSHPFVGNHIPDTIPMQPISTSATTSVPEFPRVDTSYTPHHQYDSTDALSTSRPSPQISRSESIKSPTTPGLQLTSMELSRNTRIVDDAAALTSPRLFLWARHIMTRWFTEWWMLEIMSWCFSAMCMVAIIGILIIYDGHGIPSWPLGLTINGFVIVFSNLAKSALLLSTAEALGQLKWNWFGQESRPLMFFEWIDMASRGPWGALLLLIKNRGITLTSLGALIVILALPLDVFFQQIVVYPQHFVPVMVATIPSALTYSPLDGLFAKNGTQRATSPRDITSASESIYLDNSTVPTLGNFNCPTSNCTWEPFETLAVCSRCTEMSGALEWNCATSPADWLSDGLAQSPFPNVTTCGYWFNQGDQPLLMSGYVVTTEETRAQALAMRIFSLTDPDPLSRAPILGGSLHFQEIHNPILDFLVSGTPYGTQGVYANQTPILHECVLHWCVKTIKASVEWGILSENVTNSVQLKSSSSWPWFVFNDTDGTPHNRFQTNFSLALPLRNNTELEMNTFTVGNLTMVKSVLAMDEIAPSYTFAVDEESDAQLRWLNGGEYFYEMPQDLPYPNERNPWLPPNDVNDLVERWAGAMSVAIRTSPGYQLVIGTAWRSQPFVKARWEWISLPLALLAAGLAFLVATVIKSSNEESHVGIWKTSVIAVFANGVGDEVQRIFGPKCKLGEARAKAKELRCKLQLDDIV